MNKTEKLSHIGILLIGISALVVSIWQVKLAQHHNKLSVRPYLRFIVANTRAAENNGWEHSLSLVNSGQGPAIIESFEYEVEGKRVQGFQDALTLAGFRGAIGPHFTTTYDPGDVIEEKKSALLFGINDISMKDQSIHFIIKYRSMYEELFTLEFDF